MGRKLQPEFRWWRLIHNAGELSPTDATARADHEAVQVATAGAAVSFHS
jgi:hypothetical protein